MESTQSQTSLSLDERQRIIDALKSKGALNACPMCSHDKFALLDSYVADLPQPDLSVLTIGDSYFPSVAMFCERCGFMSKHVLKPLGLMP